MRDRLAMAGLHGIVVRMKRCLPNVTVLYIYNSARLTAIRLSCFKCTFVHRLVQIQCVQCTGGSTACTTVLSHSGIV